MLALALTVYEDGLCGSCGMHRSVTHGDHNMGRFETGEDICHVCEVIESARENDKEKPYPGQKLTLVDTFAD